ncbi:MAG: AbrB/MazE/SpoVT family DNA-binding domain-containing protein [Gemmatimonadetes bacterium]|nr:AbrB/MazE/SpoVT family DNA-binding domain-containing protein [Gemmatimonadota bacterium]
MHKTLTLRKIGGSLGGTFPKEMLDRLNVAEGDKFFLVETDDGILLTPYDPGFDKAMEVYRRGARKYRNALRELAK